MRLPASDPRWPPIVNSADSGHSPSLRFHVGGRSLLAPEREFGVSIPMNTVESASRGVHQLEVSSHEVSRHPVMVDNWAESLVEFDRARSRRRHPSNREPAWAKDGGYESAEWEV